MEQYSNPNSEIFKKYAKEAFELMKTDKLWPSYVVNKCTDYALASKIFPDYEDWEYVAYLINYKKAWAYLQVGRYIGLAKSKGLIFEKPTKPIPKPKEPKQPKIEWF